MTDPMELVGRLENWPLHKNGADFSCKSIDAQMREAAACIREMVDRIDQLEAQIENIYFDLTED